MVRQRVMAMGARPRAAIAVAGASLLLMVFVGTVLGHHTIPTASFACDGTVTWHVDDWTTDNGGDEALAPDVEAWYSLDGGAYVKIGDFAFTADNYLTGFGGTFDAGSATTVQIQADIAPGTSWTDGDHDPADLGPWFSDAVGKSGCASDGPSTAPSTAPSPTGSVLAATGRPHPTVPATSTVKQTPNSGSSSSLGFLLILFAVVALVIGFAPISSRRQPNRAEIRRRR